MDRFGRMVLPGPLRKALHITAPAAFRAEVMGNKIELTPIDVESRAKLKKKRGLLVASVGGPKFNAADAVNAMRQDRW